MPYLFEDFVLDTDQRELRRGAAVVPIAPLAFDLLEFLIRNRERVLTKDDLIASIWSGRIVSESALSTCINAARSAINDTGEGQRLIRTLPRKGMRFVGAVREMQKPKALVAADAATEQPRPALSLQPTNSQGSQWLCPSPRFPRRGSHTLSANTSGRDQ